MPSHTKQKALLRSSDTEFVDALYIFCGLLRGAVLKSSSEARFTIEGQRGFGFAVEGSGFRLGV